MIIPWKVDVPQERQPIINWLIIAGIIGAFALQIMSIRERQAMFGEKNGKSHYADISVEEMAKDLEVNEEELKDIQQSVDEHFKDFEKEFNDAKEKNFVIGLKEQTVRQMLKESFVWRNINTFVLQRIGLKGLLEGVK